MELNEEKEYPCPCCGFLTMFGPVRHTFGICSVCGWEDDEVQCDDPDFAGGANTVSLNQARANYKAFGAAEKGFLSHVRSPRPEETPHILPFDEISNSLRDPDLIEINNIPQQGRALEYLLYLFSNRSAFKEAIHRKMFLWPKVENFFVRLLGSLDQSLELKAAETFDYGWSCIATLMWSDESYRMLERLLETIAKRFPGLQEQGHRSRTVSHQKERRPENL